MVHSVCPKRATKEALVSQQVGQQVTCVSAAVFEELGSSFLLSVVSLSSSRSFNSCSISFRASLTLEYSL